MGSTLLSLCLFLIHATRQAVKVPEKHKLYRGLGGLLELPDSFLRADPKGRRGYTEFGFLSTTENLEVAVAYSGVEEGRPHAMILELETDSVNRGACVSALSQYPGGILTVGCALPYRAVPICCR